MVALDGRINHDVVKQLLKHRADVNLQNNVRVGQCVGQCKVTHLPHSCSNTHINRRARLR